MYKIMVSNGNEPFVKAVLWLCVGSPVVEIMNFLCFSRIVKGGFRTSDILRVLKLSIFLVWKETYKTINFYLG